MVRTASCKDGSKKQPMVVLQRGIVSTSEEEKWDRLLPRQLKCPFENSVGGVFVSRGTELYRIGVLL